MKPVIELKYIGDLVDELPKYATSQSAAVDLHAAIHATVTLTSGATALIPTGIAINMSQAELEDQGMAALILPRSGLGHKQGLVLGNTVGLIDADYHGELMVSAWNRGKEDIIIKPMMKLAQLTFVPIIKPEFKVVTEFSNNTERGEGGFGSTDVDATPPVLSLEQKWQTIKDGSGNDVSFMHVRIPFDKPSTKRALERHNGVSLSGELFESFFDRTVAFSIPHNAHSTVSRFMTVDLKNVAFSWVIEAIEDDHAIIKITLVPGDRARHLISAVFLGRALFVPRLVELHNGPKLITIDVVVGSRPHEDPEASIEIVKTNIEFAQAMCAENTFISEDNLIKAAAHYFRALTTQAMVAVNTYAGTPHDDGLGSGFTIRGKELSSDAVVVAFDDGVHIHIEPQPSPVDLCDIRVTRYVDNGKDLKCWLLTNTDDSHHNRRVLLGTLKDESN